MNAYLKAYCTTCVTSAVSKYTVIVMIIKVLLFCSIGNCYILNWYKAILTFILIFTYVSYSNIHQPSIS